MKTQLSKILDELETPVIISDGITFMETYNPKLNALLHIDNVSQLTPKEQASLRKIAKELNQTQTNTRNITYSPSTKADDSYGRLYSTSVSLQNVSRNVRAFLADGKLIDFDIKSCSMTTFYHLCKEFGLSNHYLTEASEDRDAFLKKYKLTKDDISKNIYAVRRHKNTAIWNLQQIICHELYDVLKDKFPTFHKIAEKNKKNIPGSFMSHIATNIECRTLIKVLEMCKAKKIQVSTLSYDGFMPYADSIDDIDSVIEDLEAVSLEQIGIPFKWDTKPMETTIELADTTEEEKLGPLQEINKHIMDDFEQNHYAKDSTYLYKQSTANPLFYEHYMEIDEYVRSLSSEELFLNHFVASPTRMYREVATLIKNGAHLKQYKPNRALYAFKNGYLYVGNASKLYKTFSLDQVPELEAYIEEKNLVALNYIDNELDFTVHPKDLDMGPLKDVLMLQFKDMDAVEQYLVFQFARPLFPVRQKDNFRKCLLAWGKSGAGKSLASKLLQRFVGTVNFAHINCAKGYTNFTMASTHNKHAWIMNDISAKFIDDWGDENFKNFVEGGSVNSALKGKDERTYQMMAHLLLSSNVVPRFTDTSGEIEDRLFTAHFCEKPKFKNTRLEDQISEKYLVNIILKSLYHYEELCKAIYDTNHDVNPLIHPVFKDSYRKLQLEKNEIAMAFSEFDQFDFTGDENDMLPLHEINGLLDQCKDKTWDSHIMASLFHVEKKKLMVCKSCKKLHKKGCCNNYSRDNRSSGWFYTGLKYQEQP